MRRGVPQPKRAYLKTDDAASISLGLDDVLGELGSTENEVWLEIRCPLVENFERSYLVVEFDFPTDRGIPYLRNGYQSWSYAGLARSGEEIARPGVDMAVMSHFSHLRPPFDDEVLAESEGMIAFEELVAFALDGRVAPACFFAREDALALSFDLSRLPEELEGRRLDIVAIAGIEKGGHLEVIDRFLSASALLKRANAAAPLYTGWCSWYQYFSAVSETEFLKNLSLCEKNLPNLDVFQLDDGYQKAIGDWTETNSKFPSGIEAIARRVAEAGYIPGIWIAPFLATTDSTIYSEHPDWFLKLPNGSPTPAMLNPGWGGNGLAYALDCTHPEVANWLENLGSQLRDAGFRYVKIDFCYSASMPGRSARPAGRAEALRLGLEALRRGLGDDVFLLGCGMPLWPAVGLVDGMRIGPDVAPHLYPQAEIYGLSGSMPALANAWRNTLARAFMHRRLWVNDPDCIMLRTSDTGLSAEVAERWARAVASLGEMLLLSDDLSLYGPEQFSLAGELLELARAADRPPGAPTPPVDPLDPETFKDAP